MKYKVTLNNRTYEVEVEAGQAMLVDEYEAYAPAPAAVPMAARVSQDVARKSNKNNYLLMHAMGPNVAGVIGSAIAAGFLLSVFGG